MRRATSSEILHLAGRNKKGRVSGGGQNQGKERSVVKGSRKFAILGQRRAVKPCVTRQSHARDTNTVSGRSIGVFSGSQPGQKMVSFSTFLLVTTESGQTKPDYGPTSWHGAETE